MKLNPLKYAFGVSFGKFLGHVISKRGIEPTQPQMKTLLEIEEPRTVWDAQSLAGKIAVLGSFISKMLDMCKPFFQSIKQSTSLEWGEEQSRVFKELKKYMSSTPILSALEDEEELFLYLAVLDAAVSAMLVREEDKRKNQCSM